MPVGWYAVDPEHFGAPFVPSPDPDAYLHAMPGYSMVIEGVDMVSAGPRDTFVIHPADAPSLQRNPDPDRQAVGCCGRPGTRGNNLICPCGQEVATVMDECYGAYELHLDPTFVSVSTETL